MPPAYGQAITAVRDARARSDVVVLEGFHAIKHALRFGADLELVATCDIERIETLASQLAPDLILPAEMLTVSREAWAAVTGGRELSSPMIAVARRPPTSLNEVLTRPGIVVVLEEPRHLGNIGAVVRVAAAAGAAGVITIGGNDPWHPDAIRGGAGLQFAVPTLRIDSFDVLRDALNRGGSTSVRRLVALDPDGEPLGVRPVSPDAIVIFGTERAGLSKTARRAADDLLAIPMRPGVSSLNLATAVAITLYAGTTSSSKPSGQ